MKTTFYLHTSTDDVELEVDCYYMAKCKVKMDYATWVPKLDGWQATIEKVVKYDDGTFRSISTCDVRWSKGCNGGELVFGRFEKSEDQSRRS